MALEPEDVKAIDQVLSTHVNAICGVVYAQGMLLRELVDQGVLDEVKILERIRRSRMEIFDSGQGGDFAIAWANLATAVLDSGRCRLPDGWLVKLVASKD